MNYTAHVNWKRKTSDFDPKTFDRTHQMSFGGGTSITGSSAPEFIGKAEFVNPEELFTASIANCFMLTFLYWASAKKILLDEYKCEAIGKLGKNSDGKMAMVEVVLKPDVIFSENTAIDPKELEDLYKKAHEQCFISSSVKTKITVQSEHVTAG